MLNTESPSPQHTDLDLYATPDLVAAFVDDQMLAVQAVRNAGADLPVQSMPPCHACWPVGA
jgi:N-acetylmuramic acid 6-phosphate etherase